MQIALPILLLCAGIDWKPDVKTAEAAAIKQKKLLLVFITGPDT